MLLPLDAAAWGLEPALGILRQLASLPAPVRIGVVAIGAVTDADAQQVIGRLQQAAREELGVPVEGLGQLRRDPASFRSLLRGVSIFDLDAQAASARSLEALCRRLHQPAVA